MIHTKIMKKKTLLNIFSLYFFIFVTWSFYRYYFRLPEWIEEIIIKPLIWLTPTFLLVVYQEKRKLSTIGLSTTHFFKNVYLGWGLGALFAFEGLITNAIKYRGLLFIPMGLSILDLTRMLLISLMTAFSEEVVFRGYIMNRLNEISKNELVSNLISAILFSIIHIPIAIFVLQYELSSLSSYLFLMLVLGIADGYVFTRTGTIVAPTISHALWNFSVILFR